MKKISILILLFSLVYISITHAKEFHGSGEVTSVDPIYSRVTINHSAIKGFSGDTETEFSVKSPDLLKKISKLDLVDFDIEETKGDAQIVKIVKTGQGHPKEEGVPLGEAAQGVLESAGTVVKTVTSPIAPVSDAAGGVVSSTGSAINNAEPKVADGNVESKTKF